MCEMVSAKSHPFQHGWLLQHTMMQWRQWTMRTNLLEDLILVRAVRRHVEMQNRAAFVNG